MMMISLLLAAIFTSCMTLTHTVGEGAKGNDVVQKKQWYALWGLVPINKVDSKDMAGGAKDYTIKSQVKFIDYIISAVTGMVTINVQTVEVKK